MNRKTIDWAHLSKINKRYPTLGITSRIHPGIWGQLRDSDLKLIRARIKEATGWRDDDLNWAQVGNIRGRLSDLGDLDMLAVFDWSIGRYNEVMLERREQAIEVYETS